MAARFLRLVWLLAWVAFGCEPAETPSAECCECPAPASAAAEDPWESSPAASNPVDLAAAERRIFSQFGEDGVIAKIFELIEPTRKFAVEFGAADGVLDSNVRNLILNQGWDAFQIEGDETLAAKLAANYHDNPRVKTLQAWVWPGNIEILFEENGVPQDFDLLVIDIDSNDYYVWRAIQSFRPKVVMIEVNAIFEPPKRAVIDFHPMNYWDQSTYSGASLQSLYDLGKKKGYELVYHTKNSANAFFVDAKYFPRFGIPDNSPAALYNAPPEEVVRRFMPEGELIPEGRETLYWKELRIEKRWVER